MRSHPLHLPPGEVKQVVKGHRLAWCSLSVLIFTLRSVAQTSVDPNQPPTFEPTPRPDLTDISPKNSPASKRWRVAFFPPIPPVYGAPIPHTGGELGYSAFGIEPPLGLGHHVGEYFYPALSTRLVEGGLSAKLTARLELHLASRWALVNELKDALVAIHDADRSTRERELRAFAAQQTPRIVAHEAEADRLRHDIITGGVLGASVDWSKNRQWRLGSGVVLHGRARGIAEC